MGTEMRDVLFKPDGTKMYLTSSNNDAVYQYSLSTAWDVSTASYESKSFSLASFDSTPQSTDFNSDGTKFYMNGQQNDSIRSFTLSTAYDISTASDDGITFSLSSQDSSTFAIALGDSGNKLYMVGNTNDTIYQYSTSLTTQTLDLSTGNTFSFTTSGATTVSFTNPPASGLAIGFTLEVINTGGYTLTWPSSVKWHGGTAPTATYTKDFYSFITTDGGKTYYGRRAAEDIQ